MLFPFSHPWYTTNEMKSDQTNGCSLWELKKLTWKLQTTEVMCLYQPKQKQSIKHWLNRTFWFRLLNPARNLGSLFILRCMLGAIMSDVGSVIRRKQKCLSEHPYRAQWVNTKGQKACFRWFHVMSLRQFEVGKVWPLVRSHRMCEKGIRGVLGLDSNWMTVL